MTLGHCGDLSGQPVRVIKFALDVTVQALARQRSEHVASLKESVAAGAHELNLSMEEIAASMVRAKDTTDGASAMVAGADSSAQRQHDYIKNEGAAPEGQTVKGGGPKMLRYLLGRRKVWGAALGFAAYGYVFFLFLTWLPN